MREHVIPNDTRMVGDIPELQEYRNQHARALEAAQQYNGTQASYESLTACLIALEQKAVSLKLAPGQGTVKQERLTAEILSQRSGDEPQNISALLSLAEESRSRAMRLSLTQEPRAHAQTEDLPLFVRRINDVILPPDQEPRPLPGEGVFEPARFQERLFELLELLRQAPTFDAEPIFFDDCIVTIGRVSPLQMRQASYAVVEIPRINRTVLVCDQVGEATFVIHGLGDPSRFLSMSKQELLESFGASVRKIIRDSDEQWRADLGITLFTEQAWEQEHEGPTEQPPVVQGSDRRSKLDVREFAAIREAIIEKCPTAADWVKMTNTDALALKVTINGKEYGMKALAKVCGVQGNPINNTSVRHELGRKIYGDEAIAEALEQQSITLEHVRAAVFEIYLTAADWVKMTNKDALAFKVTINGKEYGMKALAKVCGVSGDPINNTSVRHELGRKIFGDEAIAEALRNRGGIS